MNKAKRQLQKLLGVFMVGETFVKVNARAKRETDSLERLPHRAGAKKRLPQANRHWLARQVKEILLA